MKPPIEYRPKTKAADEKPSPKGDGVTDDAAALQALILLEHRRSADRARARAYRAKQKAEKAK